MLWPDTGSWYNAEVRKVNVKAKTASLWYVDSEELEDINLYEAILNMEVSWPKENSPVATSPLRSGKRKPTDNDDDDDDDDVLLASGGSACSRHVGGMWMPEREPLVRSRGQSRPTTPYPFPLTSEKLS